LSTELNDYATKVFANRLQRQLRGA